jgi:acid phosphatase type 7
LPSRSLVLPAASLLSVVLLAACSGSGSGSRSADRPEAAELSAHRTAPAGSTRVEGVKGKRVEVVAVGDIACAPGSAVTRTLCRHAETARLTSRIGPDAVLALGDLQYEVGARRAFRSSYDKSWGELKPITYPVPGNHEYKTEGAAGYYAYFKGRQPGAPGYYATNLGKWRLYALNGSCVEISCRKERRWLVENIKDHPRDCSLLTVHFPRYSSGEHGSQPAMRPFFRIAFRNRVDVVLAGHDHHYERFRPMNHRSNLRRNGVVSFVSGGGGKSHYAASGDVKGSAYVEDDTFGVLRLLLKPDSFSHVFRGIDGSRQDAGERSCR